MTPGYSNRRLFLSFFRIGLFTFGGGIAMLPWLEEEMQKYDLDKDEIVRIFSLAQSMPGVIGTNVPSIVGRRLGGFWGSFWATFGVILPSFLIILALFFGLSFLLLKPVVQGALSGIRAGAAVLILFSAVGLAKKLLKGKAVGQKFADIAIVLSIVLLSFFTNLNPFVFILASIALASIEFWLKQRKGKN
jgi:chromate transporter